MVEIEYDDHTLLIGKLSSVDDSFDHEFGKEESFTPCLDSFHVVVYMGGMDYDITSALSDKQLTYFKEHFMEKTQGRRAP